MSIPFGACAKTVPFWCTAALPPLTNRGVQEQEGALTGQVNAHIDYFSITVHGELSAVLVPVGVHLHDLPTDRCTLANLFDPLGIGGRGYQEIHRSPHGYQLYAKPYDGRHCHLELKGEACTALGAVRLSNLLRAIHGDGGTRYALTRCDVAFDNCPFKPSDLRDAWLAGEVDSRLHADSYDWRSNAEGSTFYLGGKGSARKACVYDRRGPTRYELRLRDEYAMAIAPRILDGGVEELALSLIRGMAEFRPSWWAEFVKGAEQVTLSRSVSLRPAYRARDRYWQDLLRHVSEAAPLARAFGLDLSTLIAQVELDEQGSRVEARVREVIGACTAR